MEKTISRKADKGAALALGTGIVGPIKATSPLTTTSKAVKATIPKKKAVKATTPKKKIVKADNAIITLVVRANGAAYKMGVPVIFKGKKETALTEQGVIRKGSLEDFGFVDAIQPLFAKAFLATLNKKGIIPALTPAGGQSIYFLPPTHKEGGCKMLFAYVGSNKTLTINHAKTLRFVGGMASEFKTAFSKAGGKGGDIKRGGGYAEYTASKGNVSAFKQAILSMVGQ